jgi:large subunit ribosomal protein L10
LIKSEKSNKVSSIKEELLNNNGLFFADHSNIKTSQSSVIRDRLYDAEATLMILKNTLASIAASEVFRDIELSEILKGPTSIIASHKDLIATAKVLKDIIREFDVLKLKGGIIDGKLVSASDASMLANLPPKEVLIAQVVVGIASPIQKLVSVLNNLPQKLVMTLSAIQKEKENIN